MRPPRSARVRLGGYVILPRLLDKCRAEIAGLGGEYHYNCPLDQRFFQFTGIDAEALKREIAKGIGDWEVLQWIQAHAENKREEWEISQWSQRRETAAPADNESREFMSQLMTGANAAGREDVETWFDALDVDDHVTYGGKA